MPARRPSRSDHVRRFLAPARAERPAHARDAERPDPHTRSHARRALVELVLVAAERAWLRPSSASGPPSVLPRFALLLLASPRHASPLASAPFPPLSVRHQSSR